MPRALPEGVGAAASRVAAPLAGDGGTRRRAPFAWPGPEGANEVVDRSVWRSDLTAAAQIWTGIGHMYAELERLRADVGQAHIGLDQFGLMR